MKTTKQNSWMAKRFVHLFQVRQPLAAKLFAAIIFLAGMTQNISAQTYSLTGLWYAPANPIASDNLIVSPGDHNRGMAYDPISNRVFVSAKGGGAPAPGIEAINADTGAFVNLLDTTVVSGGTFLLSQVGVAADGAIYAANLVNPGSPTSITKIYRWTNSTSVATVAYAGNTLSNSVTSYNIGTSTYGRVGDAMAVSGSGTGTVIVMPVATTSPGLSTNLILFTTTDGLNFSSHILTVSGFAASGSAICGVSFYTNNTLLIRTSGGAGNNVFLIQYPADIASMDAGPVPGIQLGSYTLPNVVSTTAFISYPTGTPGGLFAVASPQNSGGAAAVAQVALYTDPVVGAGGCSLLQATTNYPHLVTNGNLAGAVALDVVHNRIYSLDCNNGVRATSITTIPPQPPTISAQPVGGNAYVPFTLNVTAAGYCPLVYQWQATNPAVAGEFTNIPGANASSYTITTASTNYYRVVITNTINPSVTSAVVQVIGRLPVSNASVAQLWRAAAGSLPFLSTSDNNGRGIAYDTTLDRVVVAVASASSPSLNVLNGTTGASLGAMGTSGLTINGTFAVDQVAIADDGRVYSCNLGYNGTIAVNVWTNAVPGANPSGTPAFFSSPGGPAERYGDAMAIRGGGATTQILIPSSLAPGIGVGPGTNVVLLTTTDGINFSSTVIGVSGVPGGFAGSGVAFGTGNSFWAKSYNGDLFQIAYDPDAGTGTVMLDYSSSGQVPQNTMGLGIDPVLNLMATILQGDVPDSVALFQLTGTTAPPVLFNQSLMSNNGNANANGAIVMKNNRLYALDVNNGVIALSYASPAGTAPSIVTQPQSTTAYTNTTANFTVVASGTLTLNYQWRFNSNNIVGAPNSATYSVVNPSPAAAGYYDVVVQNASGSITSAPALLTVKIPVLSPVVTNVWALAPGSRSYLDSSTYSTRGLAYDPTPRCRRCRRCR